jgi:hypothetical protein
VCAVNPADPACVSCAVAATCDPSGPACAAVKADPNCQNGGYFGPTDDSLNTRFFNRKQRFGVDPLYPVARYVAGLTAARVPKHGTDHDDASLYVSTPTCTNPVFAASLPGSDREELCNLPRGPRARGLVLFATIGGAPPALVAGAPQWTALLGEKPEAYDFRGMDPHMEPSVAPRAFLPRPSATKGDNGSDPVHGREYDTQLDDMQYACTFVSYLRPVSCTTPDCDCPPASRGGDKKNPPLCDASADPNVGLQIREKAYPTHRAFRVARDLGDRAVAGTVCGTPFVAADTLRALEAKLEGRVAQ